MHILALTQDGFKKLEQYVTKWINWMFNVSKKSCFINFCPFRYCTKRSIVFDDGKNPTIKKLSAAHETI